MYSYNFVEDGVKDKIFHICKYSFTCNIKLFIFVFIDNDWTCVILYDGDPSLTPSVMSFQLGLEPYHGMGIIGFNSPEWFIAYFAAIHAG